MDFNYLNYCTLYNCTVWTAASHKEELNYNKLLLDEESVLKYKGDACFSFLYSSLCSNMLYDIDITLVIYHSSYANKKYWSNYCLLNEQEFRVFTTYSCDTLGVEYEITRYDHYYLLHLKMKSAPQLKIKFVTTWFRYLYEHPYNICMYDTVRLFIEGYFKNLDLFNAFNLIALGHPDWGTGHACTSSGKYVELIPTRTLISRFTNKGSLNSLYEGFDDITHSIVKRKFNVMSDNAASKWLSTEQVLSRWGNIYLPNINSNNKEMPLNSYIVDKDFNLVIKKNSVAALNKETIKEGRPNGRMCTKYLGSYELLYERKKDLCSRRS